VWFDLRSSALICDLPEVIKQMALPSTIYRTSIQLSDVDRGIYETLQATVARHPSETEERLVLRILAYALFYEEGLSFTRGICAPEEPDLWVKGGDGRVLFWLEVGLPEPERLVKACRHAERVVLVAAGRMLPNWEQQHLPKLSTLANLIVVGIDHPFVVRLVTDLERSVNWEITVTEGTLYLTSGGDIRETALRIIC
jgi:uncharacterized protein YaeQ